MPDLYRWRRWKLALIFGFSLSVLLHMLVLASGSTFLYGLIEPFIRLSAAGDWTPHSPAGGLLVSTLSYGVVFAFGTWFVLSRRGPLKAEKSQDGWWPTSK